MTRAAVWGFAAGVVLTLAFCLGVVLLDHDMPDPMEEEL